MGPCYDQMDKMAILSITMASATFPHVFKQRMLLTYVISRVNSDGLLNLVIDLVCFLF